MATTVQWWHVSSAAPGSHPALSSGARLAPAALAKSSSEVVAATLGNYPNPRVNSGGNAIITPDAVPANATSINVATTTSFQGTLAADPATGVVRVTNAHPLGTYTVTVQALDSGGRDTTTTFTLTVQASAACPVTGAFTDAADSTVGSDPLSVAIGDFNNDGQQDIATANVNSATVSIRLGDGSGGFSGATDVSVGADPQSVAIGDFNHDGQQDFAVANAGSGTVSIRLGDGLGGFIDSAEVSVGTKPFSVAIGDFNHDGQQDLAAANQGSATVSIRLGDGLGGFSGATDVSVGANPQSVAVGDFNNDGQQDLAATSAGAGAVSIRLGDGLGGFSGATDISVGTSPQSVAIGDFNNDGQQDFAAANLGSNTVSIRLGDGLGSFSGTTNVSVGANPQSVAIGDFNNDGKQDIAAVNQNSATISIRLGDGLGGFSGTTEIPAGSIPVSLAIGDFNHDGQQDFAVAVQGANTVPIRLGACDTGGDGIATRPGSAQGKIQIEPAITAASGLSRQQGSPETNSQIATVTDDDGDANVIVTTTSGDAVNGVTISNIVNTGGIITADISASCSASNASFTLQASDGSSTVSTTINVAVTPNTGPTLNYTDQTVAYNGSLTIDPSTIPSDNGAVSSIKVQSAGTYAGGITVSRATGIVYLSHAFPLGTHTITIQASDECGVTTDATFNLTVNQATTTTEVTTSLNPSVLAGSVTITATVNPAPDTSGTVQFKDGAENLGSPVTLDNKSVAELTTSELTAGMHSITAVYSGDANFLASSGSLPGDQVVNNRSLIAFSQSTVRVNENGQFVTITVNRSGDTSPAVNVDYASPDDSAAVTMLPCSTANGSASPRCDFTTALGTLKFAPGETSKTFNVLLSQDSFVEGNETFTLTLSNLTGGAGFAGPDASNATVTIADDDLSPSSTNPIDDAQNFVRQHYHDFLNREPDAAGLNFWTKKITDCGNNQSCIDAMRVSVSTAFFLSNEFQNSGYYVERIWKTSFGDLDPTTIPVSVRFTNFLPDTQEVGAGVGVDQANWETQLDNNKSAFALAVVQRSGFLSRYPALTSATAFVDALNNNAGNVLSDSERSALISELSPSPDDSLLRAGVLRKIADNALLQQREFNRAFAVMQYFGYLRRNPDAAPEPALNFDGYNLRLNKLNLFNGNFVDAEMVKAFITSSEYRQRFGR